MCKAYEEYISRVIDQDLTTAEEEVFVAHLQMCETCRKDYEALRQLKRLCGQVAPCELPKHFHQDLMAKIAATPQQTTSKQYQTSKKKNHQPIYRGFVIAASFILLCALTSQLDRLGLMHTPHKAVEESALDANEEVQSEAPPIQSRLTPEEQVGDKVQEDAAPTTEGIDLASVATPDTVWEVQVMDVANFKQKLIAYLKENKLAYEASENDSFQLTKEQAMQLDPWLNKQGITKQVITGTNPEKIVIKLLPQTS